MDGGSWTEIFTSKYFGSNDPFTGEILDGRWANLEVPTLTSDFMNNHGIPVDTIFFPDQNEPWHECLYASHISSPYGLLRAPWNYNPAPYLTRFNNINGIKDLSSVNTDILTYYDGIDCEDYHKFIKQMKGKSSNDFLSKVEDESHGNFHFTVAGAGGDHANSANDYLREKYDFDDNDLVVLARAGQKFFKYQLTLALIFIKRPGHVVQTLPVICTNAPWDPKTETLSVSEMPGEVGGPSCVLNPNLAEDEDSVNSILDELFKDWTNVDPEYETKQRFLDLDFSSRVDALSTYISRFQFDGDMASSAAAIDPIFWVAHGSIERLYQKLLFESYITEDKYISTGPSGCSGHAATGTKAWLAGFSFNSDIDPTTITNSDFVSYLNPDSDFYRDNFYSIYDHSDWSTVCAADGIVLFKSTSMKS